ncbi:cation:proton antiporter [Candidatus Auribacterota bacterium]
MELLAAFVYIKSLRKKKNNKEIVILALGIIFATTSIAISLHLSPLITNMALGTMLINLSANNHRIFRLLEPLTPPIYALFFVIAGTELQPQVVLNFNIMLFGVAYILLRALGKYTGVFFGAYLSKSDAKIRNYLGLCMFPQAGVAIGLVLFIQATPITASLATEQSNMMINLVNIVLLSVFVNELVGPLLSKIGIVKGVELEE